MKILRAIHTLAAESGGPIEGLKQASRIMTELGVEIEIATLDAPDVVNKEVEELPWRVYPLGPGTIGKYGYSPKMRAWLDGNVRNFDAIIIHGSWQYHGLAVASACARHNIPYFVYPHGMLDPWFNETYPLKKLKKRLYWSWGEHRVLKNARAVLFTCEEERLLARRSFKPYEVKEKVIGYGTQAPDESIESLRESAETRAPFFLFLARIQEKKGLDLLVSAYTSIRATNSAIPDLLIAGPVQQPDYAERIKSDYPQEGIEWIGSINGRKKWQLLAQAEALILPSHQENFGIVVAEALAVGTPVLISNKVNIHKEIERNTAGLVENDDLPGTCQLIKKWLSLTSSQKEAISKAAITTFHQHFEIRQATENLIHFIRESLETHANEPGR